MQQSKIDPDWAWSEFEPTEERPWDRRLAAHLYRRAGFGAGEELLQQAVESGPQESVRRLLKGSRESQEQQADFEALAKNVLAGGDAGQLAAAWLYRLLHSPDQLREKMTLFWHGHFATSAAEKVDDADG